MKTKFSTIDIVVVLKELNRFQGMRVNNVYDIDNKLYLIRLQKPDEKSTILLESGARIHLTEYEWPKNQIPSGFSMKLRKHIKSKRLESAKQLGIDRIVDMQFGSGEVACHVILELYDRGNIILTDQDYICLNVLRPRTDKDTDVRVSVREPYPLSHARQYNPETIAQFSEQENIKQLLASAKKGDGLKKILNPHIPYGAALLEHCLLNSGLAPNSPVKTIDPEPTEEQVKFLSDVGSALKMADKIFCDILSSEPGTTEGFITLGKVEKGLAPVTSSMPPSEMPAPDVVETYIEFHPRLWSQLTNIPVKQFDSFSKTVDDFFSHLESQKLDLKAIAQEKTALKKLDNIRKDHDKRVTELQSAQSLQAQKAALIEMNSELVEKAIFVIRSAVANQIGWAEIQQLVDDATKTDDPVASSIKQLKLETDHIMLLLKDPYYSSSGSENSANEDTDENIKANKKKKAGKKPANVAKHGLLVDIDLSLGSYANARKFFDVKKQAAVKEQKTLQASKKALKSAEQKAAATLKQVQIKTSINKSRKTYWFEKFFWFISSENYLVVGGRDQQQNELIVKRHLRPGDVYVHADIRGASSIVVKNNAGNAPGQDIPPKTLNEAGTMAICYSAAWEAKVVTSAWWVYPEQVSKTAPTGEYLTTGSFMIRGKKNYLPPSQLIMGFGILFKLDEECVDDHANERKVQTDFVADNKYSEEKHQPMEDDEIQVDDADDSDEEQDADSNEPTVGNALDDDESSDIQPPTQLDEVPVHTAEEASDSDTSTAKEDLVDHKIEALTLATSPADNDEQAAEEVSFPDVELNIGSPAVDLDNQRDVTKMSLPTSDNRVDKGKLQKQAVESAEKPQAGRKRGQKHKEKKMKGKYGDQDEEERELRLQILGSAGPQKETKKEARKAAARAAMGLTQQKGVSGKKQTTRGGSRRAVPNSRVVDPHKRPDILATDIISMADTDEIAKPGGSAGDRLKDDVAAADEDDEDEEKAGGDSELVQILTSLTGTPHSDTDVLLFGVPVCAPYAVLSDYKYKVKLTPGSNKKGKSTKTAISVFLKDKDGTQRETDLLKSLQDTDMARNLPGKVKVSAPQLAAAIKAKKRQN